MVVVDESLLELDGFQRRPSPTRRQDSQVDESSLSSMDRTRIMHNKESLLLFGTSFLDDSTT